MTMDNMFLAQDYSFDDQHRLTHFKYDLAPHVLANLSQTLLKLLMHDGVIGSSQWRNHPECEKLSRSLGNGFGPTLAVTSPTLVMTS